MHKHALMLWASSLVGIWGLLGASCASNPAFESADASSIGDETDVLGSEEDAAAPSETSDAAVPSDSEAAADSAYDGIEVEDSDSPRAPSTHDEGCDPLVPSFCAYPFPSMRYVVEDTATTTGYRVALTEAALPPLVADASVYLEWYNQADGFSPITPLVALFPEAFIDGSALPTPHDFSSSLAPEGPVQLIDLDTGERIPIWAELELRGKSPDQQPLIIRPLKAIPFGHRVAAVVTDSLRTKDGAALLSSPAFQALRDGGQHPGIEGRRSSFDTLFDTLGGLGVERERVVLAWQVVVASQQELTGTLTRMVEAATEAFAEATPSYTVTACYSSDAADLETYGCLAQEHDELPLSPHTWRRIYGTVALPNFLNEAGRIVWDADGQPQRFGTREAEFLVNIPISLANAEAGSVPLVSFGHGLFADPAYYLADDLDVSGQMALAKAYGGVFFGTRWLGLSSTERVQAARVLEDYNNGITLRDLLAQGVINQVLVAPFIQQVFAADSLMGSAIGGGSMVDPERLTYTGISLGGIFGTTLMALSPFIKTGVLHVPTAGFAHIFPHSPEFSDFQGLMNLQISDLNDQQLLFVTAQRIFDVADPVHFVGHITSDPITDQGPKNCLWQCAVGDVVAPWYGCDMLMRTGGYAQVSPAVRDIAGIPLIDAPSEPATSALHYYDPQLGVPPLDTSDVYRSGAHSALRRNPEIHQQIIDYFDPAEPGRIVNHCDGACVVDPVPAPE